MLGQALWPYDVSNASEDMSQFATNASAQAASRCEAVLLTSEVQDLLVLHKSSSLFVQDACHVPRAHFWSRFDVIHQLLVAFPYLR